MSSDNASVFLSGEDGNITLGGKQSNTDGDILIKNKNGDTTLHLDGEAGDIILSNADCAESFEVVEESEIGPGTVVVIDETGKLQKSTMPYDKKVAGVVSGAGDLRPGIILGKNKSHVHAVPIALVGRVNCKVDASYAAVQVGDLLTTSPTPGHAMKVGDPTRAFGAVLGKALLSLSEGRGLIPMLIALQ